MHKGMTRAFLKNPPQKKAGELLSEQKPGKNNDKAANGTLSFKRTSI
jgi:hypothetical protein